MVAVRTTSTTSSTKSATQEVTLLATGQEYTVLEKGHGEPQERLADVMQS